MIIDTQMQTNNQLSNISLLLSSLLNSNFTSPVNNVTISDEEVLREKIDMEAKKLFVRQHHRNKIYYSEKSGWFTSVDDVTCPRGKRKIRKCSEERLWLALYEWYSTPHADTTEEVTVSKPKLADVYNMWRDWFLVPGENDSNVHRIDIAFSTYYTDEPLTQPLMNKPMEEITSLELRQWADQLLRKYQPIDKQKFSRIFLPIKRCYEYASDEDYNIVPEDLWIKARKKINRKLITPHRTPSDESQVFTNDIRHILRQEILQDMDKQKSRPTSAGLQILFMLETGLRIGECCGLKWTDIKNGMLQVRRQANNSEVKEWLKTTNGYRDIPLTDEAFKILAMVRAFNRQNNLNAEWIFQSADESIDYRLSYNAVNNKLSKLCTNLGIDKKTSHKLRKTCLSNLMTSQEISTRTIQRFAGHSDITTTLRYYTYDTSSKEEQRKAINKALTLGKWYDS